MPALHFFIKYKTSTMRSPSMKIDKKIQPNDLEQGFRTCVLRIFIIYYKASTPRTLWTNVERFLPKILDGVTTNKYTTSSIRTPLMSREKKSLMDPECISTYLSYNFPPTTQTRILVLCWQVLRTSFQRNLVAVDKLFHFWKYIFRGFTN